MGYRLYKKTGKTWKPIPGFGIYDSLSQARKRARDMNKTRKSRGKRPFTTRIKKESWVKSRRR